MLFWKVNFLSDPNIEGLFRILVLTYALTGSAVFVSAIKIFVGEKNRTGILRLSLFYILFILFITIILAMSSASFISIFTFVGIILLLLLFFPFPARKDLTDTAPLNKIDERDTMFSRNELVTGSRSYKEYYENHPGLEKKDRLFRREPGLLAAGSKFYHRQLFELAERNFQNVRELHPRVSGNVNKVKLEIEPEIITDSLRKMIKNAGAINVGFTKTRDYHFYSHRGRGEEYGKEIIISHKYAIAFTVEMQKEFVDPAPGATIVYESSRQYLNAGLIAVLVAERIRNLGFDARAHIDGNYQVVCPLVARDAGLGEIGRMGILMTPEHGPRVRIGVITTDLEIRPDPYIKNNNLIEFCSWCRKCAVNCPAGAIPAGGPLEIQGVKRWKVNQESCYTFWCKAGTDCGRCMAVCPYSHPDRGFHRFVRWGVRRAKFFRYLAVHLDDFFYGKKPRRGDVEAVLRKFGENRTFKV